MKSSAFLLTLRDFAQDRLAVAPAEAGIDDQRRARADDDADVGDQGDVAVGNDVGVPASLTVGVLFDERVGRGAALSGRARRHQQARYDDRRKPSGENRHPSSCDPQCVSP